MVNNYIEYANIFKAMSDPTRLKIIDMISCKEMCACDILEKVDIKQSTLSYHMKLLSDINIVRSTPKGSWVWYSLNEDKILEIKSFLNIVTSDKEFCICETEIPTTKVCSCSRGELK